ncbi:MAG TPA: general secretion pathway protein GspB [Telluria sp.]
MSYILEALKKAQAERELGSAPTIHAAPVQASPARAPSSRKPLLIGLGVGALVAAAAAYALLRQPPVVTVAAAPPPVAAPVIPAPPPEPVAAVVKPAPAPEPKPKPVEPPPTPAPAPAAEPAPAVAAAPAPVEDDAPPLSQLPDNIQREIPQVTFGGYMYSSNPADRLLLIDKVLRREGEQVAPGLTLERLLPKAAVMNYRGYRYRVPF